MKKQVELSITHNGKDVVAYPYTKKEHVQFENGMNIDEFVGQDIATPTITHDTTAIKVGVGDSDVSSSVVDSAVNMTIKGQTYQNILPELTLRNEMQGKSMQRLNEGYDSIETVDGVSKSAILKGQTLVNLVTQKSGSFNGERFLRIPLRYTLKTNVKYFVKFNVRESSLTDGVACRLRIDTNGGVVGSLSSDGIILVNDEGYNYIEFYIKNSDDVTNGADAIIDDITLIEYQEGMENWGIPYFEGMTSCKMPVLTTIGKNLFNGNFTRQYPDVNGVLQNANDNACSELIKIKPNTYYSAKSYGFNDGEGSYVTFTWYNNGTFISRVPSTITPQLSPSNANQLIIHRKGYKDVANEEIKFMLIEGEVVNSQIEYEPHKTNILHTPEEVVLKGIGDAQDTLNCNTGEYVERIKEVVFDGSDDENWVLVSPPPTDTTLIRFDIEGQIVNGVQIGSNKKLLCDKLPYIYLHTSSGSASMTQECVSNHSQDPNRINVVIKKERLSTPDVTGFKQWLQSNNLPIQYEVATPTVKTVDLSILDQNGGTQENLHSFANGHLQVSSEVENSLLPSVRYEIPTKNSYHMDLMKTNTLYTMKAKTVSGTFTIDGTSYNVNANGTFTSPSSMTDKLLVMSNKTNEEVMLLEGNVIDKTIPYFKGIKSAFEDEDKIEVLSTGKNLFDIDKYALDNNLTRVGEDGLYINRVSTNLGTVDIQYKKKTQYVVGYQSYELLTTNDNWTPTIQFKYSDGTQEQLYPHTGNRKVSNVNKDVVEINIQNPWANVTANVYGIYVEEFPSDTTYEPHKSNTTKIPLLSPLRSLPNGVCDELIIDRLNHKAKLIQRIGEVVLDGSDDESWTTNSASSEPSLGLQGFIASHNDYQSLTPNRKQYGVAICDTLPTVASVGREGLFNGLGINIITSQYSFTHEHKEWLSKNPTTVLYELETPIITGIDLEGYPYAYKDGHIFLNSDIAPTTQITYSINQAQQIESANENLQRHEKEITHLQKLIAQYIQVEYESTLLSLKI